MRRPALVTLTTISAWTVGGLWLDGQLGTTGQLLLGVLTTGVLVGLLALHAPAVRLQALGVVAIATVGEVVGSLIWGLYGYRLENLPAFVLPATDSCISPASRWRRSVRVDRGCCWPSPLPPLSSGEWRV